MAALPTRARREADAAPAAPRERKSDPRGGVEVPRADRRAASGSLWEACAALLSSGHDPGGLERALDGLRDAFACDGVALFAISAKGRLDPLCARGDWEPVVGDLRECMGVPLFRGRERVGALDLRGRRGQHWQPDQLALLRTASAALGAALGTRLELERLRRMPGRDAVTGLADRKAFEQRLLEEAARAERSGLPLAVVMFDLDHFSGVNERFGRPAGDGVLAEAALVLKLALREGDVIGRLDADHFGVLLPDCDVAPARRLAERLRRALEEHRFARVGHVSATAGVATAPRDGVEGTELLAAAELALRLAQKAGRRRTMTSARTHVN